MAQCNDDPDVVRRTEIEGLTTGVEITSNRPPVNPQYVQKFGNKALVYMDGTSAVYDATLNQTKLENNINKYYLMQLLELGEETSMKCYVVCIYYGRVGYKGQMNLVECGTDLEKAKSKFEWKFWEKTKNEWMNRDSFVKVAGKYDLVKLDYDNKDAVASKLDPKVQELLNWICNVKVVEDGVVEMNYDTQKAPLGIPTADQIKAGYLTLEQIEKCLEDDMNGDKHIKACDAFYTSIPHNFGMQRPPLIQTKDDIKAKLALLDALSDIQVAFHMHPIDRQYHALKCEIKPIKKTSKIFKLIQIYTLNTHGKTHNQYTMTVEEVFYLDKEGEKLCFNNVGNRMLLWHGSRMTNWASILGQGLRIAPPEAQLTGNMFGHGVYFADMSSKSANYCFATRTNPTGLLTLCEVALGNENQLLAGDCKADALPTDKQSVKGLGRMAPDPAKNFRMDNGTIVPLGKGMCTGLVNRNGRTLNYNEYVVYSTNQIRMRYLVKIKFHFK